MRILLVDSDYLFRKLLQTHIRSVPNASVVAHASGEEQAVLAARLCHPDVVLTELRLEDGNGFSALSRMRTAGFAGVAYAVTEADEAAYGPRCLERGIDGYYDKYRDLGCLVRALTVLELSPVGPVGTRRALLQGIPASRRRSGASESKQV